MNIWNNTRRNQAVHDLVEDMLCYLEDHPEDFDIRPEAPDVYELLVDMNNRDLYAQIPYAVRLIFAAETNTTLLLKALSWWCDMWEEEEDAMLEDEASMYE